MTRVAGALAVLAAALVAAGCGSVAASQQAGSAANGRQLFIDSCGACHVLADAGTQGTVGPDLDQSYEPPRAQGFDESTIRDIVRAQIAYPTVEPSTGEPGMPANLVTGQDAWDVAAYVAAVAGRAVEGGGEAAPLPAEPRQQFSQLCGSCHVLADAGTQGTIGPSLDQVDPDLQRAIAQIRDGGGGMPAFGDRLSDEQIRRLAEYVLQAGR